MSPLLARPSSPLRTCFSPISSVLLRPSVIASKLVRDLKLRIGAGYGLLSPTFGLRSKGEIMAPLALLVLRSLPSPSRQASSPQAPSRWPLPSSPATPFSPGGLVIGARRVGQKKILSVVVRASGLGCRS